METLNHKTKKERHIFSKGPNGVGTCHWLCFEDGGFSGIKFTAIDVFKTPVDDIYIELYQFYDGAITTLEKLKFQDFITTYSKTNNNVRFKTGSKVLLNFGLRKGNEMIMLSDNRKVNYDDSKTDAQRIDYSSISDFRIEVFYSLY